MILQTQSENNDGIFSFPAFNNRVSLIRFHVQVYDSYDISTTLSKDLTIYPLTGIQSHDDTNSGSLEEYENEVESPIDSRLLLLENITNANLLDADTASLSSMGKQRGV